MLWSQIALVQGHVDVSDATVAMPGIRLRRALDGNFYSYAQFREWYGEEASWRCWFEAQVDVSEETTAFVLELFRRGIIPGFDGSLLHDGEWVFVVNPCESNEDDHLTFRKIDYWYGMVGDQPMCQMYGDERNYTADESISPYRGFTVQCVTYLQRRWRRWLVKRLRTKVEEPAGEEPDEEPERAGAHGDGEEADGEEPDEEPEDADEEADGEEPEGAGAHGDGEASEAPGDADEASEASEEMDAQVAGCQRNLTISAAISAQLGAEAGRQRSQAISAEIDAAAGSQRSLAISAQLDAERDKQLDEASEAPATRPPRPPRPHWQSMVRCFALRSGAGESA